MLWARRKMNKVATGFGIHKAHWYPKWKLIQSHHCQTIGWVALSVYLWWCLTQILAHWVGLEQPCKWHLLVPVWVQLPSDFLSGFGMGPGVQKGSAYSGPTSQCKNTSNLSWNKTKRSHAHTAGRQATSQNHLTNGKLMQARQNLVSFIQFWAHLYLLQATENKSK